MIRQHIAEHIRVRAYVWLSEANAISIWAFKIRSLDVVDPEETDLRKHLRRHQRLRRWGYRAIRLSNRIHNTPLPEEGCNR